MTIKSSTTESINFIKIIKFLSSGKKFILGLTLLTALLTVTALKTSPVPPYKSSIHFLGPDTATILEYNYNLDLQESYESIFKKLITELNSKVFQEEVFVNGDYITKINGKTEEILSHLSSIQIEIGEYQTNEKNEKYLVSNSASIEMEGKYPIIYNAFLQDLVTSGNNKIIAYFQDLKTQSLERQLDRLSDRIEFAENFALMDRKNKIIRMQETDKENLKITLSEIESARYKAKMERLALIEKLTYHAKLAEFMGFIDNIFFDIDSNKSYNNSDFNILINKDNQALPEWYLYGSEALNKRIKLLQSRTSDDPFVPGLIELNNQITKIQNNHGLATLVSRVNDSPFIPEISNMMSKKIELESHLDDLNFQNFNFLNVTKEAASFQLKGRPIILTTLISAILGFILSSLLYFIIYEVRHE
jgi:LPS O-antigen subunit length determinant protein (WzzB/FepE family)